MFLRSPHLPHTRLPLHVLSSFPTEWYKAIQLLQLFFLVFL